MSHQSVLSLMMVHDIKPKPNKVGFFGKLDDSLSEKLFKIGNLVIKKRVITYQYKDSLTLI